MCKFIYKKIYVKYRKIFFYLLKHLNNTKKRIQLICILYIYFFYVLLFYLVYILYAAYMYIFLCIITIIILHSHKYYMLAFILRM